MNEPQSGRSCLKRSKSVVVRTATDQNGRSYVTGCSGKSIECVGLGCFLVELGGEWPFKEED